MRRSLAVGAAAAAVVALSAVGASGSPGVTCPTHHIQVLRAAGGVRVILDLAHVHLGQRTILACKAGRGVVIGRKLVSPEDQNDHILAVLITGSYAALVQNKFASDGDGEVDVIVANATTRHVVVRTFGSTDPSGVLRAVLGTHGTVAWVDNAGVLKAASPGGATGTTCVFDHGPVTASSLHRSANNAMWTDGSTPHVAPLGPGSCVP